MKSEKDKDLTEEEKDIKAEVEGVVGEKLEEDELLAKYGAGTSSAMYPRGVSSFNRSISPFGSVALSKAEWKTGKPSDVPLLQRVAAKVQGYTRPSHPQGTGRSGAPEYRSMAEKPKPKKKYATLTVEDEKEHIPPQKKTRMASHVARDKQRAKLLGEPEPEVETGLEGKKKASERLKIVSLGGGAPQELASSALKDKKLRKLAKQKTSIEDVLPEGATVAQVTKSMFKSAALSKASPGAEEIARTKGFTPGTPAYKQSITATTSPPRAPKTIPVEHKGGDKSSVTTYRPATEKESFTKQAVNVPKGTVHRTVPEDVAKITGQKTPIDTSTEEGQKKYRRLVNVAARKQGKEGVSRKEMTPRVREALASGPTPGPTPKSGKLSSLAERRLVAAETLQAQEERLKEGAKRARGPIKRAVTSALQSIMAPSSSEDFDKSVSLSKGGIPCAPKSAKGDKPPEWEEGEVSEETVHDEPAGEYNPPRKKKDVRKSITERRYGAQSTRLYDIGKSCGVCGKISKSCGDHKGGGCCEDCKKSMNMTSWHKSHLS